ncbi:MAG: glucosamine-6-phosphate deaminase [Opitutaceae bacterium]|nr:glucosamine-6-phosphate deaminase [Opitutaceae bacterium]
MPASADPSPHTYDRLRVWAHSDRATLGYSAAVAAAAHLRETLAERGEARVIFACAPSQDEFLAALTGSAGVALDWSRVTVFHMDDYVGLTGDHPQSFRRYLQRHLLDHVKVRAFHPLGGEVADLAGECRRYADLLETAPIDLACLGIGENGHIAFNDPPLADFDDPALVKLVTLPESCRAQQVNDGCFPSLATVPRQALTLTIPVFRHARRLSIHVPGPRKAAAVRAALLDPVTPACPASILRLHPAATLHLDPASAAQL